MRSATYQLPINIHQILALIRQLPLEDKKKVSRELEKDLVEKRLTRLLNAFKTDKLSEKTINEEVEKVRAELYEKSKKNKRSH